MNQQHYSNILRSFIPFFLHESLQQQADSSCLAIMGNEKQSYWLAHTLKQFNLSLQIDYLPAWDCLPYDRVSPARDIQAKRAKIFNDLANNNTPRCIVTSPMGLIQKISPLGHFQNKSIDLRKSQSIHFSELIEKLLALGYMRCETTYEPGDFAVRGSIIDCFSSCYTNPLRIDFFGNEIETIKYFDPHTQKSGESLDTAHISPVCEIMLDESNRTLFRQQFREHFQSSKENILSHPLYEAITEKRTYPGFEHWLPVFFEKSSTILDYCNFSHIYIEEGALQAAQQNFDSIIDYYKARLQPSPDTHAYHPTPPELGYITPHEWEKITQDSKTHIFFEFARPNTTNLQVLPFNDAAWKESNKNSPEFLTQFEREIKTKLNGKKSVIFVASSLSGLERWKNLLNQCSINYVEIPQWLNNFAPSTAFLIQFSLDHGFESLNQIVITEQDFFGEKQITRKVKKSKPERFFQELANLSINDIIVHREHGMGRYGGLETVQVNNIAHDCLKIIYEGDDKLFLPVENIELISRYGSDYATIQLDKLGSQAWQNRKGKVKKRLALVAEYLIKLAAERTLHKAPALEIIDQSYEAFCAKFPYTETDDQLRAIDETLHDLASGQPMDRLICGDVGFGKTEIAIRAAFVAAHNKKQVAIITPTSLLCRQHFHNFTKRFTGTPFKVAQLSRLVSTKNASETKAQIERGEIDIVVGTHALLSDQIKFADLGLLIVDEEQHFGVKQKEKLKALKNNVHVLTMTATPIPRTLQLSLTGVRDLSLIATPPIDRLAVRTFVMPYDPIIIREAILREFNRGGQIFFVSPRVEDIPKLYAQLSETVPEVKITIAHGQMPVKELDEAMTDFYDQKYDLLLSTNIIESGIDISTANTIILHRCDLFGLSQLYQLRGRVGRGKSQGYAYLTYNEKQVLSDSAKKRLQVMQNIDSLGAGFTIASHDMDIRGAGNIVGEEQSGHIREVGTELYQTLLQEAIIMARAEEANEADGFGDDTEWSPQINMGIPVLIPERYVSDLGLRLGLYRRVAHLKDQEEINLIKEELLDRFGPLPGEVKNLLDIISLKNLCKTAHIEKLDIGPKGIVISFRNNQFLKPNELLQYLQSPQVQKTWHIKLRPDQKLVLSKTWTSHAQRLNDVHEFLLAINKLIPVSGNHSNNK